jgi:hypothetical protein
MMNALALPLVVSATQKADHLMAAPESMALLAPHMVASAARKDDRHTVLRESDLLMVVTDLAMARRVETNDLDMVAIDPPMGVLVAKAVTDLLTAALAAKGVLVDLAPVDSPKALVPKAPGPPGPRSAPESKLSLWPLFVFWLSRIFMPKKRRSTVCAPWLCATNTMPSFAPAI